MLIHIKWLFSCFHTLCPVTHDTFCSLMRVDFKLVLATFKQRSCTTSAQLMYWGSAANTPIFSLISVNLPEVQPFCVCQGQLAVATILSCITFKSQSVVDVWILYFLQVSLKWVQWFTRYCGNTHRNTRKNMITHPFW